ncbi:MAG: Phenol hydroxylase P5 protein [Planctomycetes bacterium ADurb.Bin126]|nr:MAG: Phenol hydroxylase P5 protein [Planctomycetes bacterium ADurb.Bin126]
MRELQIVLIATAVVCGVCTVLTVLLLLAERFIANYGRCTIDINQGARRLEVRGGSPLLGTLMEEGVFIPSACGGKGSCGECKVKVLAGGGPIAPTEAPLLSDQQRTANLRISCQVKVRNDMAIEVPPELFSVREYQAVVERIVDLTHDIKELRLKLIEPGEIEFTAGQYIQLKAPPYAHNEAVYRAYSVASPPDEKDHLELIIRLVPGGICTTWVFEHLTEGHTVSLNGPYGKFRLSDSDREMVWIAGGSGMAPFWSMVRFMKAHNIARKCTYFFGAVRKRDLFLVDELRQLERELDWFTFVPALSGPAAEDNWSGETGLITEVVDRHIADGSNMEGYLCGSGGMIDAAVKVLLKKGIAEDCIFYDKFT